MRFQLSFGLVFVLAALRGDDSPDLKLLDLNVVALDSHEQPVNDLTIDDFQVTDAGKPQKIVFSRHRDSALRQAPKLAPNEASNRERSRSPTPL